MFIKWFGNTRNWKFSYEIKLSDTGHEGKWENRVPPLLCRTWISFRYFWLVGKHSRMPSGLFSIRLLVGGLREEKEMKAERELNWCTEKFQKKVRVHILVFICFFDFFWGGRQYYSCLPFFTLPKTLPKYKCSRECTDYEMITPRYFWWYILSPKISITCAALNSPPFKRKINLT